MSSDQRRVTTSNSAVPEASETSVRELAGELEADVILGQQKFPHAPEVGRLVVAHPKQFGQGEAGEHRVGRVGQDVLLAHGWLIQSTWF